MWAHYRTDLLETTKKPSTFAKGCSGEQNRAWQQTVRKHKDTELDTHCSMTGSGLLSFIYEKGVRDAEVPPVM